MKRALGLVAGLALFVIMTKVVVEDLLGLRLDEWLIAWVSNAGAGSALVVAAVLASDIILPVPSSVVMVLSGAAFGVWQGALVALAGSILGEWVGFELARAYGVGMARRLVGDDALGQVQGIMARHGAGAVLVTRPLPVVMETMSVVAGLSNMTRRSFLGASVVGTAPITLLYAYAGHTSRQMGSIAPAVVVVVLATGAAWLWHRQRNQPR